MSSKRLAVIYSGSSWLARAACTPSVSTNAPMYSARGSEPKGGHGAWLYCCIFSSLTIAPISSGLVTGTYGPVQVFSCTGLPKAGSVAVKSGVSS